MLVLTNCKIYAPELLESNSLVCGSLIDRIVDASSLSKEEQKLAIDLKGKLVIPGMIDLQVNGFSGHTFYREEASVETLLQMDSSIHKTGVTSWYPTNITDSWQSTIEAVEYVAQAMKQTTSIAGIHLEGPFISPNKPGTHPLNYIIKLDKEKTDYLIANRDVIKIITIAPEEQDLKFVEQLAQSDIIISVGHSNASYEQVLASFDKGVSMATHCGNAMSLWQGRDPGVFGAMLTTDQAYGGVIVDDFHLHAKTIQTMIKFNPDYYFMVTDAIAASASEKTEFNFAGKKVKVVSGKVVDDNGVLSGSNTTMIKSLQLAFKLNLHQSDLSKIFAMTSTIPAQAMKLTGVGRIVKGYSANLTILNEDLKLFATIIAGKVVYGNLG